MSRFADRALWIAHQSSADIVQQMLAKHGKNLSDDARQKIADAAEEVASSTNRSNVITVWGNTYDLTTQLHSR